MVLGHMAGEISPDMMFWVGRQKMSRMSADGQKSVWMGVLGLVACGEHEKFKKKSKNSKKYQYLATHDHCAKISLTLGWPAKKPNREGNKHNFW